MPTALQKTHKKVGERIRARREMLNISQEALADAAEITPAYLSQLENGLRNPTVAVLHGLCLQLSLGMEELFTGL